MKYRDATFADNNELFKKLETYTKSNDEWHRIAQEIATANMSLVYSQVNKYVRRFGLSQDDKDELNQQGVIGLMRAIDKFDLSKGYMFSTYALRWIYQTISRYHQSLMRNRLIALPVHIQEELSHLNKIEGRLIEKGIEPTIDNLSNAMNQTTLSKKKNKYSSERISYLINIRNTTNIVSLNILLEDESTSLQDMIAVDESSLDECLIDQEVKMMLDDLLSFLNERQREILIKKMVYRQTLEEIGHFYGIGRERVRQIIEVSIRTLRTKANSDIMLNGKDSFWSSYTKPIPPN
jgi:RNA polymerase primary sigma factor